MKSKLIVSLIIVSLLLNACSLSNLPFINTQTKQETPEIIEETIEETEEENTIDFNSIILSVQNDEAGIEQYDEYYLDNIEFTEEISTFKIISMKRKVRKVRNENNLIINTELRGEIKGLDGTYIINVPVDQTYNIGDILDISYKTGYNFDTDETIITDIKIEKNNIATPSEIIVEEEE